MRWSKSDTKAIQERQQPKIELVSVLLLLFLWFYHHYYYHDESRCKCNGLARFSSWSVKSRNFCVEKIYIFTLKKNFRIRANLVDHLTLKKTHAYPKIPNFLNEINFLNFCKKVKLFKKISITFQAHMRFLFFSSSKTFLYHSRPYSRFFLYVFRKIFMSIANILTLFCFSSSLSFFSMKSFLYGLWAFWHFLFFSSSERFW